MPILVLALALAAPNRIAVLDVRAHAGIEATLAQGVSDDLVVEVRRRALGSTVFGADEIRTLVGLERQKQLLGCAENSCLAEIGGALGARQIVSGSLNRFGGTYLLVLKLLDARNGRVIHEASSRFDGEGEILDVVASAVQRLFPAAGLAAPPVPPGALSAEQSPEPRRHSHALSIVLGSSGLVCGGIAIYGLVDVLDYQSASSTNGKLTVAQATSQLGTARTWQVASIVLGIAGVGLATAAVFTW
jgi:TolB-like protein